MVIVATVFWIVGFIFFVVAGFGLTLDSAPHEDELFEKYYESWGGTRFYPLWIICLLALAAIWPIALFTLWIIALIKKW